MNIDNKENGIKALEEIENILKQRVRDIEEETGKPYRVLIGVDENTDVFMCINLDDYFRADCWLCQIPVDIVWRDADLIRKDLDEIRKEINATYEKHERMLEELKEVL